MANEELAPIATSFWTNDEGWQIGWPAALLLALVVHAFAFMGAAKTPPKKIDPPIEMAIAMPPPPPEPPPAAYASEVGTQTRPATRPSMRAMRIMPNAQPPGPCVAKTP